MPIDLSCPNCGKASHAPDSAAGKRARCRSCGTTIEIVASPPVNDRVAFPQLIIDPEDNPLPGPDLPPALAIDLAEAFAAAPPDPPTPIAAPTIQTHIYKMVQVPPNIEVMASQHRGSEAATYLESVVNHYARYGWEFHRVDTLGVLVRPGCLAAFFFGSTEKRTYYVITFRRPFVR